MKSKQLLYISFTPSAFQVPSWQQKTHLPFLQLYPSTATCDPEQGRSRVYRSVMLTTSLPLSPSPHMHIHTLSPIIHTHHIHSHKHTSYTHSPIIYTHTQTYHIHILTHIQKLVFFILFVRYTSGFIFNNDKTSTDKTKYICTQILGLFYFCILYFPWEWRIQ